MGPSTLFVIAITTARMVFPGQAILPDMTPADISKDASAYSKTISMELSSDKAWSEKSTATVEVPESLGVGASVTLTPPKPIQKPLRPIPVKTDKSTASEVSTKPAMIVTKTYWGSGESIAWGQPKISEAPAAQSSVVQKGTSVIWPSDDANQVLPGPDAKLPGKYRLTSSLCGDAEVTLSPAQKFLPPVTVNGFDKAVDFAKPIKVKWMPVARAVGYVVIAMGGNAKESVIWTSGENPDIALAFENTPLTKEQVERYIKDKTLLPTFNTACTIPAGVFKDASSGIINIIAIGPDMVVPGENVYTHVIVRSIANIPMMRDEAVAVATSE